MYSYRMDGRTFFGNRDFRFMGFGNGHSIERGHWTALAVSSWLGVDGWYCKLKVY